MELVILVVENGAHSQVVEGIIVEVEVKDGFHSQVPTLQQQLG